MNNCTIDGRVGKDAEIRNAGSTKVLSFSLANTTGFGDKKKTTWYNVSAFGQNVDKLQQSITKGKYLILAGEISMDTYEGRDGSQKQSLNFTTNPRGISFAPGTGGAGGAGTNQTENTAEEEDNNIPF